MAFTNEEHIEGMKNTDEVIDLEIVNGIDMSEVINAGCTELPENELENITGGGS